MRLFQENKIAADISIMMVCIGSAIPLLFGLQLEKLAYGIIMTVVSLTSLVGILVPFFTNFASIRINIFVSCAITIFMLLSCLLGFWPGNYGNLQSTISCLLLAFTGLFVLSLRSEFESVNNIRINLAISLVIIGITGFLFVANIKVNPSNWVEILEELCVYAFILILTVNLMFRKAATRSLYACVFLIFVATFVAMIATNVIWLGQSLTHLIDIPSFENTKLFCSTLILASLVLYSLHTLMIARTDVEQLRSLESGKSYSQLLKVIQDGYVSIDPVNMVINECSGSAAKMLGLGDRNIIDLKKEDKFGLIDIVVEVTTKNTIIEKKIIIGSQVIELKFSQSPIRKKSRVLALVRDVTEIERQIELEVRKTRILEVLVDIANAANRFEGINETSSYTIATILELLKLNFGVIFVNDKKNDHVGLLSPVGATGMSIVESSLSGNIRNSLSYKSIFEHKEILIDSTNDNFNVEDYPMIRMLGLQTVIITPFFINTSKNGCLFIGSKEKRTVTAEETQLVRTIATQIGTTLDRGYLMTALDEKYKQLELTNKVKDDLITMIGHELRTPLTSIVGYVELLDTFSENLNNKQKDFVSVLHHQTDMLAWLVSQITMLTSLKTGKYRLDLEPIDICQVISSLSGRLSEISDIKQVRIISDITKHQKVNTDRNAFLGICMNLVFAFQRLSNVETMISLCFHDTREKLTIEVSDNSSPFGSQDMEIIYEMFTSLPTKPSTTIKGTIGLPLSIAKEFTLLLSGKIWFDNDAYGNRVIVELPFANA